MSDARDRALSPRPLSYEDAEREAIELEALEADHRQRRERAEAAQWRAGARKGIFAPAFSKIEAERRRKRG